MIWNDDEQQQLGFYPLAGGGYAHIFRSWGDPYPSSSRAWFPDWIISATTIQPGTDNASGAIIHQRFPGFLAYWCEESHADGRFLKHQQLRRCITLPIPLDSESEEVLAQQYNCDIWLEEALAWLALKHQELMSMMLNDCALDGDDYLNRQQPLSKMIPHATVEMPATMSGSRFTPI